MPAALEVDTVVLDVDGTLVDSVYTHVMAWSQAFRAIGTPVPAWRIHHAIGMGGDRLVTEVAGQRVEDALGDRVRELHDQEYDDLAPGVQVFDGADDLLVLLKEMGFVVVLASSGTKEQTEQAMAKLTRADAIDGWVSSADVDRSKPAPDLVETAVARVDGSRAVMVGDSVWDVRAAAEVDVPALGLLCGGFCEGDLRDAGARAVFESPVDLVGRFSESGIRPVAS